MELDSELDPDPHYKMYANPKYRTGTSLLLMFMFDIVLLSCRREP